MIVNPRNETTEQNASNFRILALYQTTPALSIVVINTTLITREQLLIKMQKNSHQIKYQVQNKIENVMLKNP